ncbi:carbohydrate ABC transporter permease [Actinopolymorpha rutila]|uniref:ABC-type glycerol-3-phosphate transport system permease component n=1 Tax=Actinopolymorpha rutila TaxID=446787 RepID=A0A852Z4L6_9ACTN|nr:carbohydrate ABC transporter permease [Actinopolymorpha rutila]NYH88317.1 ABC-type glycerol-3-phosphate transport system permease component [Actinopolymorpha rutila]
MNVRRVVVHVALAAAVVVTLLPYLYLVTGTFKSPGEIFQLPLQLLPDSPTFAHYRDLFNSELIPFARQMLNSAVIATLTTALVVSVSASVGWGFAKYDFPLRSLLFVVLLATLTLPLQVALVPLFSMMVSLNWLDTFQGVVLPSGASAFGAFFVRQAMLAVPDEMVQAARIDGASEFRIFLTMGVPLARGALSVLAVLTFLGSWNDFLWPSIVLRSPERQTYPVGLANLVGFYNTEYGMILAGSFLVTVPIIVLFVAGRRHILDNLMIGSVKS